MCVTGKYPGLEEILLRQGMVWLLVGVCRLKGKDQRDGDQNSQLPDTYFRHLAKGKVIHFQGMFLKAPLIVHFFLKYLWGVYSVSSPLLPPEGTAMCRTE